MTFSDREEQLLQRLLSQAPLPATPDIASRLATRLRRRRAVRLTLAASAILLLALWQLPWTSPEPTTPPAPTSQPNPVARMLWQPPVERFDVIDRQREALLIVLEQLDEE